MKLTEKVKQQIDAMDYERMLRLWRFAPVGTPMFEGESGDYFAKVLQAKTPSDHAGVSKKIGWEQ